MTDGDGVRVAGVNVRLAGLDAPEWDQKAKHRDGYWFNHGKRVKSALIRELGGKHVSVSVEGMDKFGRLLGTVTCEGSDIGEWLVRDADAFANPFLGFARDGTSLGFASPLGTGSLRTVAFAATGPYGGQHDARSDGITGALTEYRFGGLAGSDLSLQAGWMSEANGAVGSRPDGAFGELRTGTFLTGAHGRPRRLSANWTLLGSAHAGVHRTDNLRQGIVRGVSGLRSSAFAVGLTRWPTRVRNSCSISARSRRSTKQAAKRSTSPTARSAAPSRMGAAIRSHRPAVGTRKPPTALRRLQNRTDPGYSAWGIAALVRISVRRIKFAMASGCPYQGGVPNPRPVQPPT